MSFLRVWISTLVAVSAALPLSAAIPASERAALEALFNSTNGAQWTTKEGWQGPAGTECTWRGVTCDTSGSTVTALQLGWGNLAGPLPEAIGDLTNVEILEFVGNAISGTIPGRIGLLTKLRSLDLSFNKLTGALPASMGNLSSLTKLDLSYNELSGPIPAEIGQLSNLQILYLLVNRFTGPLPAVLGSLTRLQILVLSYNQLTGEIGTVLDRMPDLVRVDFGSNLLTGPLPSRLDHLTKLEDVRLYDNGLTGEIPTVIGTLTTLKSLSLGVNRLTGTIPSSFSDLLNLEHLALNSNELSGTIPDPSKLLKLKQLFLGRNKLSGTIPSQIGQLTAMTELDLSSNELTGEIPPVLGNLIGMLNMSLSNNQLTGRIPAQIGNLVNLESYFDLSSNKLTGEIPPELGRLSKTERFYLFDNQLSGAIPAALGGLNAVRFLRLDRNQLEGEIPEQLARPELVYLFLGQNRLTGSLPASIFTLAKLQELSVGSNQLSGPIPADTARLTELVDLDLSENQFSGPMPDMAALSSLEELDVRDNKLTSLPAGLSQMKALRRLIVYRNEMAGSLSAIAELPSLRFCWASDNRFTGGLPDFSRLASIEDFWVSSNHLGGAVPSSIGSARTLKTFDFSANLFSGELPASLTTLPALTDGASDLRFNALFTANGSVRDFMNRKQAGGNWEAKQTIAPSNVSATGAQGSSSVVVSWTPIEYQDDPGGYRIGVSANQGGPFETLVTTPSKGISAATIDGLQPSTTYFFTVTATTYPHDQQKNVVSSNSSPVVSAQTTPRNPVPPNVIVFAFPQGMVQSSGGSAATDRFLLTNVGDVSSVITLTRDGDFFDQSPASFTLAGGASQEVRVTATATAVGSYRGASRVAGAGVPPGFTVPVQLLVVAPPAAGFASAQAESNRIDVTAPPTTNPTGEVKFINRGTAPLTGIVVSDVGWITPLVPAPGLLEIAPGATATVAFAIDRNRRPDSASLVGAAVGTLSLIYLESSPSSAARLLAQPLQGAPPGSASTVVTVVDTVRPPTTSTTIPGIGAGQVALFLPGVGHVTGGAGRFYLSDLSIFNAFGTVPLTDMNVYYTPAMGFPASSLATAVGSVQPGAGITYANVVNSVFSTTEQQGTIQIRTRDWDKIFVNANIFNVRDPNGTYGTSIPLFRSDRSAAPGATLTLSGLRRDAARSVYSNLLIQETSGLPATASIQFFDSTGRVVLVDGGADRISVNVDGFTLARVLDRVPVGAVAAIITNSPSSQGRIAAYGTLVDNVSGDFWTVVDWNQQYGSNPNEAVVIPVAGSLRGANDTFFRTDLAITNLSTGSASGILRYRSGSQSYDRALTFAGSESRSFADVVGTSFTEAGASSLGYLIFTPGVGGFSLNSRTFASVAGLPGTFGTGVPSLPLSAALRLGQSRVIAGLEVASKRTIERKKPGTFRTNIGLVEVAGATSRVRVTVTYADVGSVVSASRIGILEFALEPNAFLLISNLADLIGQASASADLRNVQLKFQVIAGEGAVIPFTSSVDNGTADQVFRVE